MMAAATGFPLVSIGNLITIGSPASGDEWGYMDTPSWSWGTISPTNATCYPDGRTAAEGTKGHIFALSYSLNAPRYGGLYLRIGGTSTDYPSVDSLPFSAIKIGATTFNKSVISFSGGGDHGPGVPILEYKVAQDVNPFVRGNNTIQFMP